MYQHSIGQLTDSVQQQARVGQRWLHYCMLYHSLES